MARIRCYMFCDSINNIQTQDGFVPHLVSPKNVIRPEFVPGSFSFGIAISIEEINLNERTKMGFEIVSPKGDVLQSSYDNDLPIINEVDKRLPSQYNGFTMNIDVRNLPIIEDGIYKFKLSINGSFVDSIDIPVFGVDRK